MTRANLLFLGVLVGCGDPTYYPLAEMPAYGDGGEWSSCSGRIAVSGEALLVVENTLTEPIDLIWVDESCTEQLVAELGSGERYEMSATYGQVFAVRGQENGFLYAHFMWLGQYDQVVIP